MQEIQINTRFLVAVRALLIASVALSIWLVASAVVTSQTTGTLNLVSSDSKANLILSQENHQALLLGTGKARVRLLPGVYQISATDGNKQANTLVTIYKKHETKSYLRSFQLVTIPTVDSVNYVGFDNFLGYGVSSDQLDNLKQDFFEYSKYIKTVIVDTNSINPTPHNANSTSTLGSIKFKVSIDSKSYEALMSYDNLSDGARLYLYNPNNHSLVFDSGTTSSSGG